MSVIRKTSIPIRALLSRSYLRQLPIQARHASDAADTTKFKKLKERQARLQCEDGVPIYLKEGSRDRILFNTTTFLLGFCTLLSFIFLIRRIQP